MWSKKSSRHWRNGVTIAATLPLILLIHASAAQASYISIAAPSKGASVSGSVTVATNESGDVSWANFYCDNFWFASNPNNGSRPFSVVFDSLTEVNGSHTLSVKGYNNKNKVVATYQITVNVSNGATPTPTPTPTPVPLSSTTASATPSSTPTPTPTPMGVVYYVDNSGSPPCSDSNAGTNPNAPWCTIAHVASIQSTLTAGQQVLFRCGDVWNEEFDLSGLHGAPGNPVVIGHYGSNCVLPNQTYTAILPVIDGGSIRAHAFAALGTSVSYVTLDGFDIHDITSTAIDFQTVKGLMPGITIENMLIHQSGPGACTGCGSPFDDGNYAAQIGMQDYTQGQDGVHILWNTVWDTGGHNTIHVHYDTSPNMLIDHNLVGPGCIHNCIDTKGINGTVSNNVTTCTPPGYRASGAQCSSADAGFYSENTYVAAGTSGRWIGNVAHDIALGFQIEQGPYLIRPTFYNDTIYNTYNIGLELNNATSANVQKCIVSGSVGRNGITTWDYNDDSGATGSPVGAHDINVNPAYVNPNQSFPGLPSFQPTNNTVCTAGATDTTTSMTYLGAVACP